MLRSQAATGRGPVVLGTAPPTPSRHCWSRGRPPGPGPAGSGGPGSCAGWPGGDAADPGLACRRRAGGPWGASPGRLKAKAARHGGTSSPSGLAQFCALSARLFSLCFIPFLPPGTAGPSCWTAAEAAPFSFAAELTAGRRCSWPNGGGVTQAL